MVKSRDALVDLLRSPSGLALVVGAPGSGKTRLLEEVASQAGTRRVGLSRLLSGRLLEVPVSDRRAFAAALGREVPAPSILDNIEVLFLPQLALDPVSWLSLLSRSQPVIAAWPGGLDGHRLTFGQPCQPDHFEGPVPACLIVRTG